MIFLNETESINKYNQTSNIKENEQSKNILANKSNMKEDYNTNTIQAKLNSGMLSNIDVMQLQRTFGNKATMQLLKNYMSTNSIQKKEDKNSVNKINYSNNQIVQKKTNNTGFPDNLKAGVENISGISMDEVRVHYNSDKPAQVGALAYTQGNDIHVSPEQEKHLPHEAWHVVQQAQGRVRPTMQLKGLNVNDDVGLEREADEMGSKSVNLYEHVDTPKENKGQVGVSLLTQQKTTQTITQNLMTSQPILKKNKDGAITVCQRKNGLDSEEWGIARRLATKIDGQLDQELALILVPMVNNPYKEGEIQPALGVAESSNDTRAFFTSVARGNAIVCNHIKELAPRIIIADATVCQDDTLGSLLDLSLLIQNNGGNPLAVSGQVKMKLLAAGFDKFKITEAVIAIPALMTTIPLALALTHHISEGGSAEDAARAVAFEPHDEVILAQALKTLRMLAVIPEMAELAQDKVNAVLKEREYIVTVTLGRDAVDIAVTAVNGDEAIKLLESCRDFAYNTEFKKHAEKQGEKASGEYIKSQKVVIHDTAEKDRLKTEVSINDPKFVEAFEKLSRREKDALGGSAKEALVKKAPFISNTYFDSGTKKLASIRIELVEAKKAGISDREKKEIDTLETVEGPERKAQVVEKYRAYFAGVKFHPDALAILDIAQEDTDLAIRIVKCIVAQPTTRDFFIKKGNITLEKKGRLLTVPDATLAVLIARVTTLTIAEFAEDDNRIALLIALHTAGIPLETINEVSTQLGTLGTYVADAACRGNLVTLLATDTVTDIRTMLAASPGAIITKPKLVVNCRPYADSANTLATILKLCAEFEWSQEEISTCFLAMKPVRCTKVDLEKAVYVKLLNRYDKLTAFTSWMEAIGKLVEKGYVRIVQNVDWTTLKSGFHLDEKGNPIPNSITDEKSYNIIYAVGGGRIDTFYVHYHPSASAADIYNPKSSKYHFKPERGGIIRLGYEQAPKSIIAFTERRPQKK